MSRSSLRMKQFRPGSSSGGSGGGSGSGGSSGSDRVSALSAAIFGMNQDNRDKSSSTNGGVLLINCE